jgi:two-component system, NtrC family, C4-dicarboxylate transport response regulator DctD
VNRGEGVLLVDDDSSNIPRLAQALEPLCLWIEAAGDGLEALSVLARQSDAHGFNGIVITDLKMPVMDGMEFMRRAAAADPDLPIIMISAYGEIATAVQAIKSGAYDFIERPFDIDDLLPKVKRALEKRKLVLDNRRLRSELANRSGIATRLVGNSPAIQNLRDEIVNIGSTDATVLIHGHTGTGKEVVARALHDCSRRSTGRFVAINCGALSENLIDSELFGHEAGAFTDAKQRRIGMIEYAKGGTLFLDEIESMPLALQVKLLRMLQERTINRLGNNQEIKVDIRLIAATKTDLLDAANRHEFREDLYFRLGVAELHIPPLNQRREDIPLLFSHFLQEFAGQYQRETPEISREDIERLMSRSWRGNVRELRNVAERHVLGLGGRTAGLTESDAGRRKPLPEQMDAVEAVFIRSALEETNGNIQAAADALGIPRRTLNEKMRRFNLERKEFE